MELNHWQAFGAIILVFALPSLAALVWSGRDFRRALRSGRPADARVAFQTPPGGHSQRPSDEPHWRVGLEFQHDGETTRVSLNRRTKFDEETVPLLVDPQNPGTGRHSSGNFIAALGASQADLLAQLNWS